MQDNSDNNINIHDQTRNRSDADNTARFLIACMQRSEKQKKINNWDNDMLEEEMDGVAGEGEIHGSPQRALLTKSPQRMPLVSQFDHNDYWTPGIQRISEDYGAIGAGNPMGLTKRPSSLGLNNNSKFSEEIFKDMQYINITKSKLGKQQKQIPANNKFGNRNEQSDVNALAILTSQVLGNVLENDSDIGSDQDFDDDEMCDVRSNDLGEGHRGSMAAMKRTIDLQHQINMIKKDYLAYFLNNYDKLLQQDQGQNNIEPDTAGPQENIQNSNRTTKSNQHLKNQLLEEKQELASLKSLSVQGQSDVEKLDSFKKQIQKNAQNFILKLIQLDVQEKYKQAAQKTNMRKQTKSKKKNDRQSNLQDIFDNPQWKKMQSNGLALQSFQTSTQNHKPCFRGGKSTEIIDNPYYKTTKIQQDSQSRLTGKSTSSQSKPINIDRINADLQQLQKMEVSTIAKFTRQRTSPQSNNTIITKGKTSVPTGSQKHSFPQGTYQQAPPGQLNDSFSKTKKYATQTIHQLGKQQINHNNQKKQKAFEKHLNNIIAEQDHEEEEDIEQRPSASKHPSRPTIQIPDSQNYLKPLPTSTPTNILQTPAITCNIQMQSFEGVKNGSFNKEIKQEDIGPKKSVKKSHSVKTESVLIKSRNDIFEDDDNNEHFDAGCDMGVIGQENIQVQNVRESSWASLRCDSISNSSTKSRKRHGNDTGKGDGGTRNKNTKIISNGKLQLTSDENVYGLSYAKQIKATEVDNIDEKTVSNSVKRSLIKQQKWTDQKQIKISLVDSPKASGNSSNKQIDLQKEIQAKIDEVEQINSQHSNLFFGQKLSVLKQQKNCYLQNKQKIEERIADITTIDVIKERFKNNKIKCIKYNYSLDKEVQTLGAFEGYIQLSKDGTYLYIYNNKSIRKPEYVFDPDYRVIRDLRNEYQKTLRRDKETNKISDDNFKQNIDFVCRKSSSSTKLSDIENILFGGLSSRFWMFRKHMIQQKKFNLKDEKMAFFSWQCITLQLKDREVDLVIPNEKDMNELLELLIDALNTTNGFKNSAEEIKQQMHLQKYKRETKRQSKLQHRKDMKKIKFLDQDKIWEETQLTKEELNRIKKTTLTKYKIMRVRAKISFIAFQKQKTVFELMFDQILQSFVQIAKLKEQELGDLSDQFELFRMNDHAFQQMISDGMGNIFERIMQLNVKELKHQDLVAYVKLKFQQAVDIMDQEDEEMQEVRDKIYMKRKKVKINEIENLEKAMQNARNLNRNASMDIFLQMEKQIKNKSILDTVNYRDVLRYKQQKYKVHKAYQKLKIVVNMKAVKGVMMLKALITKIKFAKQIFILEIEQSKEAYIPNELSNDNLPSSFWFYDACLHQVQNLIIDEKKTFAYFKNQYRLNFYQKNNFKRYLQIKLGFIDDPQKQKLSQKSQIINEIESKIIDHHTIPTSLNLQRSRYVTIDEDVTRLQNYYKVQGKLQQQQQDKQITIKGCTNHVRLPIEMRDEARMLILRYCPDQEITIQRQELLHAKSTFLNKIIFLKILGKKLILMQKVDNHIETNIDQIYRDYIKLHPRKQKANKTVYEVIMSDKLEKEDEEQAKKKLHSIMMDHIEKWLQLQTVKLRYMNTKEIREKTGPQRQFHAKNYFVETDLEKHIKWFSKVRGFDIQGALVDEMQTVKKTKNDKLDRKRIAAQANKHQLTGNNDSTQNDDDMQAQEDHLFAELAMLTALKGREKQEALQQQMDQTLYKFNQQRIDMLKKKIQEGQEEMIRDARKLNEQRQLYKKLLGVQQNKVQSQEEYQTNLKSFDANIFNPPDNIMA